MFSVLFSDADEGIRSLVNVMIFAAATRTVSHVGTSDGSATAATVARSSGFSTGPQFSITALKRLPHTSIARCASSGTGSSSKSLGHSAQLVPPG